MTGTIKKMIEPRGFGFIQTAEGEVFFHLSAVEGGPGEFRTLQPGDLVEFTLEQTSKGLRARRGSLRRLAAGRLPS